METAIRSILKNQQGMVIGGNDFLYTRDLTTHPMSLFLYQFGPVLKECGVDIIFLENHYVKEPIQTRGFIGQVMYSAYLFGMRVIGIEGKFTPEEYKEWTNVTMTDECTTVAFGSKKRLDRLNIFVSHFVPYQLKKNNGHKFLLFCGMSHVNDETDVTDCKGIKNLLGVPGVGAVMNEQETRMTTNKPFSDFRSDYVRDVDYLIEMKRDKTIDDRLYIDSTIFSMINNYYFFYMSYRKIMIHNMLVPSVELLWKHKTTIYPPRYLEYVKWMIRADKRFVLPSNEINDVLSFLHECIHVKKEIPSRSQIVEAMNGVTPENLHSVVDKWVQWIKKITKQRVLDKVTLDALSDIIFLEYKTLSTERDEDGYVRYLKRKFEKQLERPEHKLYTLFRIMKSVGMTCLPPEQCKLLDRIL